MHPRLFVCIFLTFLSTPTLGEIADEAIASAIANLESGEYGSARSAAIADLAAQSNNLSLPEDAIAALLKTAVSDSYISVRLEASRLLASMPMSATTRLALGEAWSQELTHRDSKAWKNILHPISATVIHIEATQLLADLYEPPYPGHVIDAWISGLRLFAAQKCLALLQQVRARDGFSDEETKKIKAMAVGLHTVDMRDAVFALVFESLDAGTMVQIIDDFEHARSGSDRLYAGTALKQHFAEQAVPTTVIVVADRVLRNSDDQKHRGIAAALIARGEDDFQIREKMLLAGIRYHIYDTEIANALINMYGEERLQEFVVRYVAKPRIPVSVKSHALYRLAGQATPRESLASETTTALLDAAWETSDYTVINAISKVLREWRSDVPWFVKLKTKHVQSNILFGLFVLCGLINVVAGATALLYVLTRPFERHRQGAKRFGSAAGWTALSIVMLGLQGFAFLGFLGHNAAPNPRDTLAFNVPLYLGTMIYLGLALMVIASARSSRRQHKADSENASLSAG